MSNPVPVYKAINKPLTIMGAERRLFFCALVLAAAIWTGFDTLLGGIVVWIVSLLVAQWLTKTDPQALRIIINSDKYRDSYDPVRFKPHNISWK